MSMEYNDEAMPSMQQYAQMAEAYMKNMRKKGFIFVKVEDEDVRTLVQNIFDDLGKERSMLMFMGGFLGTGKIFSASERQTEGLKLLFDYDYIFPSYRVRGDKTKCFLNFLGLESRIIRNMLNLAKISSFSNQIERFANERLSIMEEIFILPNLLTSFSR